jgi:hypothetical protein
VSKYHNIPTNGFASRKEAGRARELQLLERAGKITDLRLQVPIEILPKQPGERAVTWVADFTYIDSKTGEEVWEDVKGMRTREYILKRKLILFRFGKKIRET